MLTGYLPDTDRVLTGYSQARALRSASSASADGIARGANEIRFAPNDPVPLVRVAPPLASTRRCCPSADSFGLLSSEEAVDAPSRSAASEWLSAAGRGVQWA